MAERPEEGVNVQVLLRCRPMSDKEIAERSPQVVSVNEASREVTLFQSTGGKASSKIFRFDKAFGPDSTQEKLFKQAVVPIVEEVMDGFNCTIFAYGQTGTGKTYTMEGGPRESDDGRKLSAQAGVIPRSIKQIFDTIEANNMDSTVKVSFLELYNEELTDLLSMEDDSKRLRLLEDKSGVVVQGLEEVIVRTATEIYQVLDRGTAKRKTAATLLNQRSSRSHSVFTITIHMKEATPEGEDLIKIGKLNLVDLAGSENISRSGAKDSRAREAGSINQSLLTLGRVITALVEHSGHVPYRDSKLTRLLRDSLGGRTKTCIIATIAPTVHCQDETISTLDYAHRAKNIRNKPEVNQKISKTTMIREMAAELEKLKLDLQVNREKNGVYISNETYTNNELERAHLKESLKAARALIEEAELQHAQELEAQQANHAKQVDRLQSEIQAMAAKLSQKEQELANSKVAIQERSFVAGSLRRAEQSLAGFAERLTREIELCNHDIHGLANRLEQGTRLHASDREVLRNIQNLVSSRISNLSQSLTSALSSQASHLAAINEDVTSFTDQKQKDIEASQQLLTKIHEAVKGLNAACLEQSAVLSKTAEAGLSDLRSRTDQFHQQASDAAKNAARVADASVSALLASLDSQAQALEAMVKVQQEEAEAAVKLLEQYHSGASAGLQSAVAAAEHLARHERKTHDEVQSMMTTFASDLTKDMQEKQAQLVAQMQQLFNSFTASHASALNDGLSKISCTARTGSEATVVAAKALAHAATTTAQQLKVHEQSLCSHVSSSRAKLEAQARAAHGAVAAARVSGTEAQKQSRQEVQAALDAHSTHVQVMTEVASTSVAQIKAGAGGMVDKVNSSCNTVAGLAGNTLGLLQSQHEEGMVFAQAMARQADEAKQAVNSFSGKQQSGLGALSEDVSAAVSAVLATPVPGAPQMRQLPGAPPLSAIQDLMCPPEDLLLAQLRNTRKEIAKRGGDADQAAAMLLSPMVASGNTMSRTAGNAPPSPPRAMDMDMMDMETENTSPPTSGSAQGVAGAGVTAEKMAGNAASGLNRPNSRIPGAPPVKGFNGSNMDMVTPVRQKVPGLADKTNY